MGYGEFEADSVGFHQMEKRDQTSAIHRVRVRRLDGQGGLCLS